MKLLIVDDEQIEREGLQAILKNGYPDMVFMQAKNGKVAVQMADEFLPDLILMDIKMPGMNGLEAVELISGKHPEVKFVMVTAYDTFEYARQAIKLGVKDYLLKPSKASEIVATVGKVLAQIEDERSAREASRQNETALRKILPVVEADVVTQLLFDHVHEVHSDELVGLLGARTTNEAFVVLLMLSPGPHLEGFYAAVKDKMRQAGSGWVGALSGRHVPIVVFRETDKFYRSQASSVARELLQLRERFADADCFVGIGNPYGSLDQIRLSYQEALIASIDTSLPAKHRFYADAPIASVLPDDYSIQQLEKRFVDRISLGQWERVQGEVEDFAGRLEKSGTDLLKAQQRVLELLWIASRVLLEMGMETEKPLFSFQAKDYRELRGETAFLLDRMKQSTAERQTQLKPDAVHRIKQYILENSQEDISLETIAKRVGMSPFYISKMFKEQLGVNYIDFLTECRIEKAKKLMADPELSLKEITFEVGYNDPNYFSKVFKKTCGLSPTDYRKALVVKKG